MPSTYLVHHGIKGQKWGVRRFQNEDGSLTDAGLKRYGGKGDHDKNMVGTVAGVVRGVAKSSLFGRRHVAEAREKNLKLGAKNWQEDADYAREHGNEKLAKYSQKKADKLNRKAEAQSAAIANRKAYEQHTSTAKLVVQDLLMSKFGASNYRAARARGAGRIRSLFETSAGATPIATLLAMHGNKKAYGSRLVLSGLDNGSKF